MSQPTPNAPKRTPRILSGMRPTGKLHLGNYMGALHNWVALQNQKNEDGTPKYECFFFIADLHALTTDYADTSRIQQNTLDVVLDFMAAGLDPEISTIFVQSHVPQHSELHTLFSMFTPLSWLERVPTYKDQQEQLKEKDLATYGFLGYPLLQSADILLYTPDFVPVGQDQVAHVELTREVARRFNSLYGRDVFDSSQPSKVFDQILPEPQVLLTPSPKLPGLDGRKMSKSYNNTIQLTDPAGLVLLKLQSMSNGGQRSLQTEPGDPDICPVGDLHAVFSSPVVNSEIRQGCRAASIPCQYCKMKAATSINEELHPIQMRRDALERDLAQVDSALEIGARRAQERANVTLNIVQATLGLGRSLRHLRAETQSDRDRLLSRDVRFDLTDHKEWWDFPPFLRGKELRGYWLSKMLPSDVILERIEDRVFVNARKKRVFVSSAREKQPLKSVWNFSSKPKSYEVLVLLCWGEDYILRDFVIPQKHYVEAWSRSKRENKNAAIEFAIHQIGESAELVLPHGDSIDITNLRGDYSPLR